MALPLRQCMRSPSDLAANRSALALKLYLCHKRCLSHMLWRRLVCREPVHLKCPCRLLESHRHLSRHAQPHLQEGRLACKRAYSAYPWYKLRQLRMLLGSRLALYRAQLFRRMQFLPALLAQQRLARKQRAGARLELTLLLLSSRRERCVRRMLPQLAAILQTFRRASPWVPSKGTWKI